MIAENAITWHPSLGLEACEVGYQQLLIGALGRGRTSNLPVRTGMHYPLCYEGVCL